MIANGGTYLYARLALTALLLVRDGYELHPRCGWALSVLLTLQIALWAESLQKTWISALHWVELFLKQLDNAERRVERVSILCTHRYYC